MHDLELSSVLEIFNDRLQVLPASSREEQPSIKEGSFWRLKVGNVNEPSSVAQVDCLSAEPSEKSWVLLRQWLLLGDVGLLLLQILDGLDQLPSVDEWVAPLILHELDEVLVHLVLRQVRLLAEEVSQFLAMEVLAHCLQALKPVVSHNRPLQRATSHCQGERILDWSWGWWPPDQVLEDLDSGY